MTCALRRTTTVYATCADEGHCMSLKVPTVLFCFFMWVWSTVIYSLWNVHIALCHRIPNGLCIFHSWLQTHKVTIISHSNNVWHGLVDFFWPTFTPVVCPAYNLPTRSSWIIEEKHLLAMHWECKRVGVFLAIHSVEVCHSEAIAISLYVWVLRITARSNPIAH